MSPNRAILLTSPGGAAIAVVRLSGPGVLPFLQSHFSKPAREGRCVHGELHDAGRVIDDPVVVLLAGQPSADISVHGGPWVVTETLELARRAGFDVVSDRNSPLPHDATDGRSLIESEVLAFLPLAKTELAVRVLLAQERAWVNWEAARSRGDKRSISPADILADRSLQTLLHSPRVAIVGPPNVGKSTLANQLFAQERSIAADLPGTTRDWVGEIADVNGLAVMLVDTPGLRATSDAIEAAAIERARPQIEQADLVLLVLDASAPLTDQESLLADHPDAVAVLNKSDRSAGWIVPDRQVVRTVGTTGHGVDALRAAIVRHFGCENLDPHRPRWWTERQREWLGSQGSINKSTR